MGWRCWLWRRKKQKFPGKNQIYSTPGMKNWEEPAVVCISIQYLKLFLFQDKVPLDRFNPELKKILIFCLNPRGSWNKNTSQRSGQSKNCWIYSWILRIWRWLSAAGTGMFLDRFPLDLNHNFYIFSFSYHFWTRVWIFLHFMCSKY